MKYSGIYKDNNIDIAIKCTGNDLVPAKISITSTNKKKAIDSLKAAIAVIESMEIVDYTEDADEVSETKYTKKYTPRTDKSSETDK